MPLDPPRRLHFWRRIGWCLRGQSLDITEALIESQLCYLFAFSSGQVTSPLMEEIIEPA